MLKTIYLFTRIFFYMARHYFYFKWLEWKKDPAFEEILLKRYQSFGRLAFALADIQVTRLDFEKILSIPPDQKVIVMANHQSFLDIFALIGYLPRKVLFVAKKELFKIPILGYWMKKMGCIIIDRKDKRASLAALQAAGEKSRECPIVIFPEGTRSRTGEILPFKEGPFRLPLREPGYWILPLVSKGFGPAFEYANFRVQFHKKAHMQMLDPVDASTIGREKSREFIRQFHEKFVTAYAQLPD